MTIKLSLLLAVLTFGAYFCVSSPSKEEIRSEIEEVAKQYCLDPKEVMERIDRFLDICLPEQHEGEEICDGGNSSCTTK